MLWTADAQSQTRPAARAPKLECGDVLAFQVLLDRLGFSPGQIDGRSGRNFSRAVGALQQARGLPSTGHPDCELWRALGGGDPASSTTVSYVITDEDAKGPFASPIPNDLVKQAALPSLDYQSLIEQSGRALS